MSAKKSWDVVRRDTAPRAAARAQAPVARSATPVRTRSMDMRDMRRAPSRVSPEPEAVPFAKRATTKDVENPRGTRTRIAPSKRQPLKVKRKQQKKRFWILLAILFAFAVGVLFYVLWLPILRIQAVEADGPTGQEVQAIAMQELHGSYFFIVPRNSLFFIPQKQIRAHILSAHPDIEALTISTRGLNTLVVHSLDRQSAFWWCGTGVTEQSPCFEANAEGLVFSAIPPEEASSTAMLRLYGSIDATSTDAQFPIGAHIGNAAAIPNALRFVKAIKSLGVQVVSMALRDDEADLYTAHGTRITYVLGREQQAAGLAATAFPQLSVNDGSLEYVDLRFEGKVYFKRRVTEATTE